MENEKVDKSSAVSFAEVEEKFKKYSNVEEVFHNGLIGTFEAGKYVIDDEIKDGLKQLNKVLDQSGDALLCHAKYKNFLFNFVVEFERPSAFSSAKLYLVERKEDEDKKFKTLISTEVLPAGQNIEKRAMEVWHISEEEAPNERQISALDETIIRLSKDRLFGKDLVEILSQLYIFKMIKLLGSLGEAGDAVVKEFNEFIRLVTIKKPSIVNNFSKQKELFEKILTDSKILEVLKANEPEKLAEIYREFYEPLEKISIKKERVQEPEKAPKMVDSVEVGAKKVSKPAPKVKGEKVSYFKPEKPRKVTVSKVKLGGAGVVNIKPFELKPPKIEVPKVDKVKAEKEPEKEPPKAQNNDIAGMFSGLYGRNLFSEQNPAKEASEGEGLSNVFSGTYPEVGPTPSKKTPPINAKERNL